MRYALCIMRISDYIEKLRRKPPEERRRVAVIATGVSFALVFLIWVVSFSEMNATDEPQAQEQAAPEEDFSAEGTSIEEMFQDLPSEDDTNSATGMDNLETDAGDVGADTSTGDSVDNIDNSPVEDQNQNANSIQDNQPEIPLLP